MSFRVVRNIALAVFLVLPVIAAAQSMVCTNFDDGTLQGWTAQAATAVIDQPGPSGLATDFYLRGGDQSSPPSSQVVGASVFYFDWASWFQMALEDSCRAALEYDFVVFDDGWSLETRDVSAHILIKSSALPSTGIRAVFRVNNLITEPGGSNSGWHHFVAPLAIVGPNDPLPSNADGAWEILPEGGETGNDAADWNNLMSGVQRVYFGADIASSPAQTESFGIDNVCLKPGGQPSLMWARGYGDGIDVGISVTTDASDNVYATGMFWGTIDLGGGPLVSAGIDDIYVVKYDAAGVHQWSARFGNTAGGDIGRSIAVDDLGNVFVAGAIRNTADFGGGPIGGAGGTDVFIAKFTPNGTHEWSKGLGSLATDAGMSLGVDSSGSVYVTGTFSGSVNFGGNTLVSAGAGDIFLVKYATDGTHIWSQRFGGVDEDQGSGLAIDDSNMIIIIGYSLAGPVSFGGVAHANMGGADVFVAKYDQAGIYQWSRVFGGVLDEMGTAITADLWGNILVTGFFADSVDFGGGNLTASHQDVFVAKYSSNGTHLWSQGFGGTLTDVGEGIAVDASGDVYVTGYFDDTVDFGGGPLTTTGYHDIFMARFDANGVHKWSDGFGNTSLGVDRGKGIAISSDGCLLVTGFYTGAVDFGSGPMSPSGSREIFIVKYCNCLTNTSPASVGEGLPPTRHSLYPAVPNPFNPSTTIRFNLERTGPVSLRVFDVRGSLVRTLVASSSHHAGPHEVIWNGRDDHGHAVTSGVYFYRLVTTEGSQTSKMLLLK